MRYQFDSLTYDFLTFYVTIYLSTTNSIVSGLVRVPVPGLKCDALFLSCGDRSVFTLPRAFVA